MTDIQRVRVRKLASHHPVRVREFDHDRIVVIIKSSPQHHEFSVYTINTRGLSTDFIWFRSTIYEETFKTFPTLAEFERRTA